MPCKLAGQPPLGLPERQLAPNQPEVQARIACICLNGLVKGIFVRPQRSVISGLKWVMQLTDVLAVISRKQTELILCVYLSGAYPQVRVARVPDIRILCSCDFTAGRTTAAGFASRKPRILMRCCDSVPLRTRHVLRR